MTGKQKSRGGRPRKAPIAAGEKVQIGVRITPKIRKRLETAIATNGRSLTQEAEHRIERTFDHEDLAVLLANDEMLGKTLERRFGKQLGRLLMVLGQVGETVERLVEGLEDPDRKDGSPLLTTRGYDAFVNAVVEILKTLPPDQRITSASMKVKDLTWETVANTAVQIERMKHLVKTWPSSPITYVPPNPTKPTKPTKQGDAE